jgi:error-prone DNA polymerase
MSGWSTHGLRGKPIDIHASDWPCSVERETDDTLSLRLGLGYVHGLMERCAEAIAASHAQRAFTS